MRKVNLKVNDYDANAFRYVCTEPRINFGLSSPIGKGNTITMLDTKVSKDKLIGLGESELIASRVAGEGYCPILLTTCREMIVSFIRTAYADIYIYKPRLDKLRLVVFHTHYKENVSCNFASVVKALNVIEKAKGWKLTCPHNMPLKTHHPSFSTNACLLLATKQWIASPYMLSLYLLLIRILLVSFKNKTFEPGFNDIDDIHDRIKNSRGRTNCFDDVSFLVADKKKDWRILINHFEEIHEGKVKQHWLTGIDNSEGYHRTLANLYVDGLDKLLMGTAFNKIIGERFEKITEKI